MKDYFAYNSGQLPEGAFRISASQLSRFFDDTSNWYREFLLGEQGFTGSTASELGTIIHASAAMYFDSKQIDFSQLRSYAQSLTNPDVDNNLILEQIDPMVNALRTICLERTRFTASEEFLSHEVLPGIYVGGSCDAYDSHKGIIYDFKTTSQKTPVTSFSRAYWFQLMTYAWLYRKQGKSVNTLQLIYVTRNEVGRISDVTGKPLKDYPSQVYTVSEQITDANLEIIDSCINLIAESVQCWQQHPELRHLLAQDQRLKVPPKPILFKD